MSDLQALMIGMLCGAIIGLPIGLILLKTIELEVENKMKDLKNSTNKRANKEGK